MPNWVCVCTAHSLLCTCARLLPFQPLVDCYTNSLLNTCLLIPSSFLNLSGCPSCSSSTHCCPLRADVCCATFSKQDAYASAEAYPAIITVSPAISAMRFLVSSSRDIVFDIKCICMRVRVRGIWLALALGNQPTRSDRTNIQIVCTVQIGLKVTNRHQGGFVCNNARCLLCTFARLCPHENATSLMCMSPVMYSLTLWHVTRKGKLYLVQENSAFGWHKKILGHKIEISIWHCPNRDHARNIIWQKNSRTGP